MTAGAPAEARRARVIVWLAAGFGLLALAGVVAIFVAAALAFSDTTRDLGDFSSLTEARAFLSAHLPAPLPADAVIETLHYESWTDWRLTAQARLPSAEAVDRYLEETKRLRMTNDDYCLSSEPAGGARYFLRDVSACGSVARTSRDVLVITCHTR